MEKKPPVTLGDLKETTTLLLELFKLNSRDTVTAICSMMAVITMFAKAGGLTKKEAEDAVKDLIDQLWDGYVVAKP